MSEIPVIVVSGTKRKRGNSVLALNLAGALWNDDYNVGLLSSDTDTLQAFLQMRKMFCQVQKVSLFQPKLIKNMASMNDISALVADISADSYQEYEGVFNAAHTLITPLNHEDDISWQANDEYLNFIWKIKKNQAAQGKKYLNWIVVPYLKNENDEKSFSHLPEYSRRYGFRIAPAIYYRDEYMHVAKGYCAADLRHKKLSKQMSLADVYARHEILKLADFIWQKK